MNERGSIEMFWNSDKVGKTTELENRTEETGGVVNDLIETLEYASDEATDIMSDAQLQKERVEQVIAKNKKVATFCNNILKVGKGGV